jgi:hypothetical protein
MKKALFLLALTFLFASCVGSAEAVVRVNGYFKKNGTYVAPYVKSDPDGIPTNNWSYPGNVNPYTGKVAPGNPDTYLRNYYESNANVRNSYDSSYLYSASAATSYSNITNGYKIGSTTSCNYGYYMSPSGNCVLVPPHSSSIGNNFYCDFGYEKNLEENGCRKLPQNGRYDGAAIVCSPGYYIDSDLNCVPKKAKANSHWVGGSEVCDVGFAEIKGLCVTYEDWCRIRNDGVAVKYDEVSGKCVLAEDAVSSNLVCLANSHPTDMHTCECDYGYILDGKSGKCISASKPTRVIDKNVKMMADFLPDKCSSMGLTKKNIDACEQYRAKKNDYLWQEQ